MTLPAAPGHGFVSTNGRRRTHSLRPAVPPAESPAVVQTSPRILLITGVAGSGKTTTGKRAAAALGWPYFEADDFHSPANRAKMAAGTPLTDDDRAPWLAAIRAKMDEVRATGHSAVFTCSALKEKYREVLVGQSDDVLMVYLAGDFHTVLERVSRRKNHYMKADMVRSQFEALEPPKDALTFDVRLKPDEILQKILVAVRR
ncbi:MAG: gluconate kinase [Opitutus sp.]|nr:gluconate kinase [Opitutus sp.]